VSEASKTAELSSQPTKRGRKTWLIGLAVVVAVATIALLATPPKPEPVRVWFVRATNELGVKKLVFEATNGFPRGMVFYAGVFTGAIPHPKTQAPDYPVDGGIFALPAAGANFSFTLNAPSNDAPYFVTWEFQETKSLATRWGRFQMRCYDFCNAHGMTGLAGRFAAWRSVHYIPSTEIKE